MLRNARNVTEATDIALRGYENGGNGTLASIEQINKYTWAGGYGGSMFGKHGRANYAQTALDSYSKIPKVPTPLISNIDIPAVADFKSFNISKTPKFVSESYNESESSETNGGSKVGTKGNVELAENQSTRNSSNINFSPNISKGGSTNNFYVNQQNDLENELYL
jgi:hypothetical protein